MMRRVVTFLVALTASSAALAAEADGSYVGTRWYEPTAKKLCSSTGIKGTISGGKVRITLLYNGAMLSGNLTAQNTVRLTGSGGGYSYAFEGRLAGGRLSGTWRTSPEVCRGTWSANRLSR